jgi:hypothetical protein
MKTLTLQVSTYTKSHKKTYYNKNIHLKKRDLNEDYGTFACSPILKPYWPYYTTYIHEH